jgi:hypothetical protein
MEIPYVLLKIGKKTVIEYTIAQGHGNSLSRATADLHRQVTNQIEKGYVPTGGISLSTANTDLGLVEFFVIQALIREKANFLV